MIRLGSRIAIGGIATLSFVTPLSASTGTDTQGSQYPLLQSGSPQPGMPASRAVRMPPRFTFMNSGDARETILYSFLPTPDGNYPYAGLTPDGVGGFFGTTSGGGAGPCVGSVENGCGAVFKLTRTAHGYAESIVYSFQGPPNDGAFPNDGALIRDSAGNLFGVTYFGGNGTCSFLYRGCGVVYELSPSSSGYQERVLYNFQGGRDGYYPDYGVVPDASGNLYGDTELGGDPKACGFSGQTGCGVIYELAPSSSGYTETVIHRFKGAADGEFPDGRLAVTSSGTVFGTTFRGGSGPCASYSHGCGTVFELHPTKNGYHHRILYSFQSGNDGALAQGGVLRDHAGALYGMTVFGGSGPCFGSGDPPGCGVVFKLTPTGRNYTETVIHTFQGSDGARALGALYPGRHGELYGSTGYGGSGMCSVSGITGCGVTFVLRPSGSTYSETVLHDFGVSSNDGSYPNDPIFSRGAVYGTTVVGGVNQIGTVFRIRP